ncbi:MULTISPECIES: hypothetical protein [Alteribacter]|uniref:HTH gntR-type domain-containing protein n=1 Tax=Alteribacter keqinensis TaxID=2483800 RepID=A0A3M7TTP7_9BACI|nr:MULTISPECIES: hypothetical protein [Alteribacter]MBM7097244.1 hypothetical protein [Alteribacter salitolerans]RNA69016.1 hypothetical protein EBO34_03405 [Alteribacter keqinensis]
MTEIVRNQTIYDSVLYLIVETVTHYAENEWPSPSIEQLSDKIGYSEELILESLEYGELIEPVGLLQ